MKNELIFTSNGFETTAIFNLLLTHYYLSELTIESLLERGLIISKNGKFINEYITLSKKIYNQNKSKSKDEFSNNKIGHTVRVALSEFNIKI